jgi:hypothetical protein
LAGESLAADLNDYPVNSGGAKLKERAPASSTRSAAPLPDRMGRGEKSSDMAVHRLVKQIMSAAAFGITCFASVNLDKLPHAASRS